MSREEDELRVLQRLKYSFPYFAENALMIKGKDAKLIPFKINRAQSFLHAALQDQLKRKGKIRAIIVKGRQMGCSTYVQARFYHKVNLSQDALKAFILTHNDMATQALFSLTKEFNDTNRLGASPLTAGNAKELVFAKNKGSYAVATANSTEVGRGLTLQLFHGSEVGLWNNAESHVAASGQAVANVDGSEIILESTANGLDNFFHRSVTAVLDGESDYEVIFMPWFWHDEYETLCPEAMAQFLEQQEEWMEYGRSCNPEGPLTWEQLHWAYLKNREIAVGIGESIERPCWKFYQEYPANLLEAFQSSGEKSFIPAKSVIAARRAPMKGPNAIIGTGPIILGIDPAFSDDCVGIIDRCGNVLGDRIAMRLPPGGNTNYLVQQLAIIIRKIRPDVINIDVGGNGAPICSLLQDQGFRNINPVNFGAKPITSGPTGDKLYANRRSEMYDWMREWFLGDLPVRVPDDDKLQMALCGAVWGPQATLYNAQNALAIEPKTKIKARLKRSPDLGDAAALTFAVPYAHEALAQQQPDMPRIRKSSRTGY